MFYRASLQSERIVERNGKKIGYIHLWTMANPRFAALLTSFVLQGKAVKTDGFILDIRDGFGGRPEGYFDPFFGPPISIKTISESRTTEEMTGYGKPLVLMINHGSRSAKEVVSAIFKDSKRATLVGSNTAGNVLGTSPIKIQDWGYLEIPMVDLTVDGVRLEAVGVAPDVLIEDGFDAEGRDSVLEQGLSILAGKGN